SFWNNVLNAHVSIKEVPKERWDSADFWVEGQPGSAIEGKTYSKIGAFVEQFEFDWRRWKQPPGTLGQIDDTQLWAVEVSAAALEDAGYLGEDPRLDLPKERCGVIFANALGGENRLLSSHRIYADQFARKAIEAGMPTEAVEQFKQSITEGKPRIDEDTMPGELANVVAGRVANLLDLQGPNFSADAACASTFAALLSACQMLQTRQTDVMLCGASDCTMDPGTYAKFSAIGALSPIHSRPFDARANGFVMGEGAGCVVLKRLEDAIRDGDEIYSVIRGIGASSDGRGKGITAPSTRGQKQAVMRAYQQAGYSPTSVELIEAHGTSTKVGDATELSTLAEVYSGRGGGDHVAVGSVKSQIGHLKAAAGMAGLLKASLALHHRTLPPSAGFEQPNTSVNWDEIPFFVPTSASEWPIP
ncbi:MAG TPA: polyketide synthase, partial [Candidatus Thalassarchaeaceae archaeon]|nr:polyketide synthase [Candidatus Thalassarchaeaceae archaeon]